jgi:type I restriction enzyme S subunit
MIYDLAVERSARPMDWTVETLADLADVVGGGTPETGVPDYWNPPDIPWVTPTDITACATAVLTDTERAISEAGLHNSSATLLPPNTTLLTSRATIGECRLAGMPVATNQGFASLVPNKDVDHQFLFYLSQSLRPVFTRLAAGTTFIEVSRREIRRVKVSIPLDPQERALIGALLSATQTTLELSRAKLSEAFRLKCALMQQLFTRGIPSRHTHFKKTKIGDVPESWIITTIGSVLEGPPFNGVSPQSHPDPPGTPILNVECIEEGLCTTEHVSYVDIDEQTLKECRAEKDDFYVLRGNGNREYVVTGGLLRSELKQPTIFSDKLIRLRFKESEVARRFMPYLWQSHSFLRRIQSRAVSGSGLWMIGKRDIRREVFAKPDSLTEQQEIVALIDAAIDHIAACHSEVSTIEGVKRSLIQNVLTGKFRLRV